MWYVCSMWCVCLCMYASLLLPMFKHRCVLSTWMWTCHVEWMEVRRWVRVLLLPMTLFVLVVTVQTRQTGLWALSFPCLHLPSQCLALHRRCGAYLSPQTCGLPTAIPPWACKFFLQKSYTSVVLFKVFIVIILTRCNIIKFWKTSLVYSVYFLWLMSREKK